MRHSLHLPLVALTTVVIATAAPSNTHVVCPSAASGRVQLAAKEIRRYLYLRTGELLPVANDPAGAEAVELKIDPALASEEYRVQGEGRKFVIAGGSDLGVLYGAYAWIEKLGVRFYPHGDVIPDGKIPFDLPKIDLTGRPLFAVRGIQPFHDFPEGPDWWNQDDYLAYVGQLAKMRMNFLGLHTYPEGHPAAEPLVWIGLPQDVNADGTVNSSYPSSWASTPRAGGWGYAAMKTSAFSNGTSELFASDDYGPDVMAGMMPVPTTPEQCNELFNRTGKQMGVVFAEARRLGVKTCVGTETPLTIPAQVKERIKQLGKDPADPAVVRELYDGIFKRILAVMPADYYWLWTPEGWTWGGNKPEEFEKTKRDVLTAYGALKATGAPMKLATSGWVLGPQHDRAALDAFLPKDCPMSCINRLTGNAPVEYAFANLQGRPKWAIPWMENDPGLVSYQPWSARMRCDAVDARRLGCDGLIGIHWRTKILAMNVAALAGAAWDQSWVPAGQDVSPVSPFLSGPGGQVAATPAEIAGATKDEQAVYRTCRFDTAGYSLVVPNGTYDVTLKFAEITYDAPGKRVFSVAVQGLPLAERLDLFAVAGKNKAYDLVAKRVTVADGTLKISLGKIVEFPLISGIVISGTTETTGQFGSIPLSWGINCGGGAVGRKYEADRVGTNPAPENRAMPVRDFYIDFARAHFGEEVAVEAGELLASYDGKSRDDGQGANAVSNWGNGPGNLQADADKADRLAERFAFVEKFMALGRRIKGVGNLERHAYWLATLQVSDAQRRLASLRGQLDAMMGRLAKEANSGNKDEVAHQALQMRRALAWNWNQMMSCQIAATDTPGELGTIANLEQHSRLGSNYLTEHDAALEKALGQPLPADCAPTMSYAGPGRIIVPTVRTSVAAGQPLVLRIIALDSPRPVRSVNLRVRPLGRGEWQAVPAVHLGRAVWRAELLATREDFEYLVEADRADGGKLRWPIGEPQAPLTVIDGKTMIDASKPQAAQTVIVLPNQP